MKICFAQSDCERYSYFIYSLLALIVGAIAAGCVPMQRGPKLTPVTDHATPIKLQGFSVLPPNGEKWFTAGQSDRLHIYRIDKYQAYFFKTPSGKPFEKKAVAKSAELHTIVASVMTSFADMKLKTRSAILEDLKKTMIGAEGERYRVLEANSSVDNSLGYDCVRYNTNRRSWRSPVSGRNIYSGCPRSCLPAS